MRRFGKVPQFVILACLTGCAAQPGIAAEDEWRSYIKDHAVALQTERDPIAGELLKAVSERRLVLLGEMTHDSRRNYVPSNIALRYDGILFIRDTTALSELDDTAVRSNRPDR